MMSQSQFDLSATAASTTELVLAVEQTSPDVNDLPSPPLWLKHFARWFRVGLGLFILLSVLLGTIGCSSATGIPWQRATAVVPEAVIEQIIAQNSTLTEERAAEVTQTMQAWEVKGNQGRLVVFNFNTPDLCGALGCLYTGAWLRDDQPAVQVFSMYLNPNLPRDRSLFEVLNDNGTSQEQAILPCLKVMQVEQERLRQTNLCFDGQQYHIVDSQLHQATGEQ